MTAVLPLRATGPTRPSLRSALRRVAEAAVTPLLPDDYLDLVAPLRAGADLRGRVVSVTPETRDASTVGMRRNHLDELQDVVVVHSAPTEPDVIFAAELRALARDGRLRLVERHTDRDGVVGPADLDELVPDWRFRETWACGPTGMLDAF